MSTSLQVTVETLEKGFLINIFCDKNCPGLLVSVLEALEALGLEVLDASISCADSFRLAAVGGEVSSQISSTSLLPLLIQLTPLLMLY
ncbi:hypothetical protein B296_00037670 [Ensete ventricosum]|uniref:Plant bHLH transcription factor ACT-like domain-containing protein n=1 Tax=Ensete ventricosum TaxID=4639 RepID=A0A426Y8G0_ENSVE|nr:hypothetical protein B296_00037670 [Ensete ventricosum]